MLNAFTMMKSANQSEHAANRDLAITGAIVVFLLFAGAAIFCALQPGWTYLESFYFCIVTLTTIGLGDFTPDVYAVSKEGGDPVVAGGLFFWFLYVQFGLAIVAIVITMLGEKVASIAQRAKASALSKMAEAAKMATAIRTPRPSSSAAADGTGPSIKPGGLVGDGQDRAETLPSSKAGPGVYKVEDEETTLSI